MPGNFNPAQIDFSWISDAGDSIAGGLSRRWENQKDQRIMGAYAASGGDYNKMVAEIRKAGGTMEDITRAAAIHKILAGDTLGVERLDETKRHNRAMEEGAGRGRRPYVTNTPDEYGVNQPTIFNPEDGSLTPASPNKRYRPLNEGTVTKLVDEGGKFTSLKSFGDSFEDDFAGMSAGPIDYGKAAKTVGQLNIGTENARRAAQWWQGYDRYKNVVRKDLYGATLTPSEESAFESSDIRPGMDPGQVRHNLKIQKTILENAMKRKSDAYTASGYNPDVINRAYGVDTATLKDAPLPPPDAGPQLEVMPGAPANPQSKGPMQLPPKEKLEVGQVYDLPNGQQGLWTGEGFEVVN
jgi:hypothetical protein